MKLKSQIPPRMLNKLFQQKFLLKIFFLLYAVYMAVISCGPPPPKQTAQEIPTPEQQSTQINVAQSAEWDAAHFIYEMMNFKRLSLYKPDNKMVTCSSHDPHNGPVDIGVFADQYTENGKTWFVLADEKGPGVITRLFFSNHLSGTVKIYLDHQSEPVIHTTFQDLYLLKHEIFQLYISFDPPKSGDGFVSYFPIPFAEHCLIVTDTDSKNIKYDIDVLKLPKDSPVVSFNGKSGQRLKQAMAEYNQFIQGNPVKKYENTVIHKFVSYEIKPGETKLVANETGPAALQFFALQMEPVNADTISLTRIKMYWDDMKEAAVDTPVRDFFCSNIGVPNNWNSLPIGYFPKTDSFPNGFYYCQFYMPFQKKGQILIENLSKEPLNIKFAKEIDYSPVPDDSLYFYARNDERVFALGLIYSLFEFEGKGNFVGLNLSALVDTEMKPEHFVLEGDPYLYVDGEKYASIIHPGLDNYFGADNLLSNYTPFWLPTHGNLYNKKEIPAMFHTYRFHTLDAIPFTSSLMYIQEIGCPIQFVNANQKNAIPAQFRWTCYWYGKRATEKTKREESVYYYNIQGDPHPDNPVMIDLQVYLQLPQGKWIMNYAPVWDLSQVFQQEYDIQ